MPAPPHHESAWEASDREAVPQIHVVPGMRLSYSMGQPPASHSHGQCHGESHGPSSRPRQMSASVPRRVSIVTTGGCGAPGSIAGELKISAPRKKLILCFDGTGNKFKGNSSDTNILKVFRMLDRSGTGEDSTVHYYQPGIGTYITNGTLSRVHVGSRIKSWVNKAMDSAVGTSFDQHVIGGYKFLMRFYSPGDDIYMFGFSRGAYTARFLAEMLDHVGLVATGNEEMVLFAWKTFSAWQQRRDNSKGGALYEYMRAFRETFARPVRRVRFLGLFDTVNSVPRFEQAWLKRSSGFPYTARSTARIIRHAVGIDERRAKFRQDLIDKIDVEEIARQRTWKADKRNKKKGRGTGNNKNGLRSFSSTSVNKIPESTDSSLKKFANGYPIFSNFINSDETPEPKSPAESVVSFNILMDHDSDSEDDEEHREQDIDEVWFPGGHGDIGGGWDLPDDEVPLSHGPLVWMVREARKAGVVFDIQRMKDQNCWIDEFEEEEASNSPDDSEEYFQPRRASQAVPNSRTSFANKRNSQIGNPAPHMQASELTLSEAEEGPKPSIDVPTRQPSTLGVPVDLRHANAKPHPNHPNHHPIRKMLRKRHQTPHVPLYPPKEFLEKAYTRGKIHDALLFKNGVGVAGVLGWKMMEYLPFRRMDLQPDGSWEAIIWPLPRGEVRDIPDNVKIHCSVLRRMEADPTYRPGNLLVGGGGRGVRVAPEEHGIGDWVVLRDPGNPVGEVLMKRIPFENMRKRQRELFHQKFGPGTDLTEEERMGY